MVTSLAFVPLLMSFCRAVPAVLSNGSCRFPAHFVTDFQPFFQTGIPGLLAHRALIFSEVKGQSFAYFPLLSHTVQHNIIYSLPSNSVHSVYFLSSLVPRCGESWQDGSSKELQSCQRALPSGHPACRIRRCASHAAKKARQHQGICVSAGKRNSAPVRENRHSPAAPIGRKTEHDHDSKENIVYQFQQNQGQKNW